MNLTTFERLIAKGGLEDAITFLMNTRLTEEEQDELILIRMKLSIIEEAIGEGKVSNIKEELALKREIGYALLRIYEDQDIAA